MPHITISYRRADSDAMAGRIRDKLADHFGQDSLFMDIDSIPFGTDFREQIKSELAKNDLLIAVVGPKWRGSGKGGRARINDENDPVRVEVEFALARGIPVVPVLVNGATMPKPDELPASLRNFSFHNGAVVDAGQDFHPHMERLIRSLDRVLRSETKFGGEPQRAKSSAMPPVIKWSIVAAGVGVAAVAGAVGGWYLQTKPSATPVAVLAPPAAPTAAAGLMPPPATPPQLTPASPPPTAPGPAAKSAAPALGANQQPPATQQAPPQQPAAANPQVAGLQPAAKPGTSPPPGSSCQGTAAFEDDFRAPDAGWNRGLGLRTTGSNVFFADSHMVMKPAPKLSRTIVYPTLVFRTAAICATIQSPAQIKGAGDTSAGVTFWASDDRNLYAFEIAPDGTYLIRRLIDNNWSYIASKQKSDAIKLGPGEVNQFEVRTKQNTAELFINGVKVQEFKGQPPARVSTVGFSVRNDSENDYEWTFHNIAVFEIK